MKHKILITLFSFILMLSFGTVEQVLACWCRSITSCEATNRASAVFVGKVKSVASDEKSDDGEVSFSPKETILFKVNESFFGMSSEEIKIKTGGGSNCDYYSFGEGETYLVFAYKDKNNDLLVGRCGRTKSIKNAAEDLKYLRELPQGTQNGKLSGSVYGALFDSVLGRYDETFLPKIPLSLTGNGINKTLFTDESGDYEVNNLKAGKYRLQIFLPTYYSLAKYGKDESISEVELNGRGCSENSFFPEVENSLKGRVIDKNGKPLKNKYVYLIPETQLGEDDTENFYSAETDKNGIYTFDYVFPRRYLLGLKTKNEDEDDENKLDLFYPNTQNRSKATIIEFGLGHKLKGYNLIWQDSQK